MRLPWVSDPLSRLSAYEYDALGHPTEVALPGTPPVSMTYDEMGNVTSVTPAGGAAHGFTYNAWNLLETYEAPDTGDGPDITTYAYDADGALTQVIRPDGGLIALSYDAGNGGRLQSGVIPRGTIAFTYNDETGRLQSISAPGGIVVNLTHDGPLPVQASWSGPVSGTVAHVYDDNLWTVQETINGAHAIDYEFDDDGMLTRAGDMLVGRSGAGFPAETTLGNIETETSFNDFGELEAFSATHGTETLLARTYARDALGRVTGISETIQGTAVERSYEYDTAGRLERELLDGAVVASYAYDHNGNRTPAGSAKASGVATYDQQDRLTSYGGASYEYTGGGELLRKTADGEVTSYDYDVLGNLMGVSLPDGTAITYLVDGLNRRVGKRVDGTLVQGFLYRDKINPVAELDGSGALVSRFVYGTSLFVPDYMIRGGDTYRLLSDRLGSVRLVVNAETGEVMQRLDYDAFGEVLMDTNPAFQPFGFAGGLYDPDTGLTRFGYRDYDAAVGRWTAKDPVLFGGGDTNLYAYNRNDPVNQFDPMGLEYNRFEGAINTGVLRAYETVLSSAFPTTRRAANWVGRLGEGTPTTGTYVAAITSPLWAPVVFIGALAVDSLITFPLINLPLQALWPAYADYCAI